MYKEVNKVFLDFISRSTECINIYGKCSVELNKPTIKRLFKYIKNTTISSKETNPIQKNGKTYRIFGTQVNINKSLPNDFILFKPSGRILMLK